MWTGKFFGKKLEKTNLKGFGTSEGTFFKKKCERKQTHLAALSDSLSTLKMFFAVFSRFFENLRFIMLEHVLFFKILWDWINWSATFKPPRGFEEKT